jgi:hypothetical protein
LQQLLRGFQCSLQGVVGDSCGGSGGPALLGAAQARPETVAAAAAASVLQGGVKAMQPGQHTEPEVVMIGVE